jgi:hypothetical protein
MMMTRPILFALALFTLSACGKTGSGSAKLQFRDTTNALMNAHLDSASIAPSDDATAFKMKLIAAYLAEDINPTTQNNVGVTSMFYLNPECGDDITHCDTDGSVNGGRAEDGNPWAHIVDELFDFSDVPSVNNALNSQSRSIEATTYRYVRLEFCKYSPTTHNISWTYGGTTNTFAQSSCNVTAAIPGGLTVNDGDSVTINLAYSLAGTVIDSGGYNGPNCSGGKCFTLPTFVPSASK